MNKNIIFLMIILSSKIAFPMLDLAITGVAGGLGYCGITNKNKLYSGSSFIMVAIAVLHLGLTAKRCHTAHKELQQYGQEFRTSVLKRNYVELNNLDRSITAAKKLIQKFRYNVHTNSAEGLEKALCFFGICIFSIQPEHFEQFLFDEWGGGQRPQNLHALHNYMDGRAGESEALISDEQSKISQKFLLNVVYSVILTVGSIKLVADKFI